MKGPFSASLVLLYLSGLLLTFTGCGLKYTPPPTEESYAEERREAIETHYALSFQKRGMKYKPLNYGEPVVVKPDSYRRLDSLFERKYTLEQLGQSSEKIDVAIEGQRSVVYNDTTPVLYVETHWFEVSDSTKHEFIVDRISLNKANRIVRVEQLDYFTAPADLLNMAREYMLEGSFTSFSYEATSAEIEFYTAYKERAAALRGAEKQRFIEHTLRIMSIASKNATLSTEMILVRITQQKLSKLNPEISERAIDCTVEKIYEERTGAADVFLYYQVKAEAPGTGKGPWMVKYDGFLQEIQEN